MDQKGCNNCFVETRNRSVESEEHRQSKQVSMNSFEEICGLYLTLETLPSILWYRLLINTECKTVVVLLQETSFNYINVKIQKFTHNNSFLIFFSTHPP